MSLDRRPSEACGDGGGGDTGEAIEPVDAVDAVDHAAAVRLRQLRADRPLIMIAWLRGIAAEVDSLAGDEIALRDLADRLERGAR